MNGIPTYNAEARGKARAYTMKMQEADKAVYRVVKCVNRFGDKASKWHGRLLPSMLRELSDIWDQMPRFGQLRHDSEIHKSPKSFHGNEIRWLWYKTGMPDKWHPDARSEALAMMAFNVDYDKSAVTFNSFCMPVTV